MATKQCIGGALEINGRKLSLSRAVRADQLIFLTGQVPMRDGVPMTSGSVEEQTRSCIESIRETLALCGCDLSDVVKSTVWVEVSLTVLGLVELLTLVKGMRVV